MACGKTTFGRALAKATGRAFIDLDFYIEQRYRRTIPDIFAAEGEGRFREMERAMLREAGEFEDVIIACGGGTPCFNENMDYMLGRGTVIFLQASERRITRRILANSSKRPLMAGKDEAGIAEAVRAGLASRLHCYDRAHIKYSGENLENSRQISSSVTEFLSRHPL